MVSISNRTGDRGRPGRLHYRGSQSSRPTLDKNHKSIRHQINFSDRRFDVKTLPADLHRVYKQLEVDFGEEYALAYVFTVRTAVELHRAWHMTLLTSKVLQEIKSEFGLRMTWELGVIKLKFRCEDGRFELHRKVPYDYDSEFQDLYMKIAIALVEGRISIHQALLFQAETKRGQHTAQSGLFLRDFPGRLVLYPLEAATCAVIFFGGDGWDAMVAGVCGLAAGLVEYLLVTIGGEAKVLIDVLVGTMTGAVGGLFYEYGGEKTCLPAVFLGTLYWFFYGTAFVIGILEIATGELETGVIRFMAVSVKTFVLTMGAAYGMKLTLNDSLEAWLDQNDNCDNVDLDAVWWRIPLYLLCSASALGQYRFPIVHYWRGLVVQLVGYEVQYQTFKWLALRHEQDFLDTATANTLGAMSSVLAACVLSWIIDQMSQRYNARLLQRDQGATTPFSEFIFKISAGYVKWSNYVGLGRKTDLTFLQMEPKLRQQAMELRDPNHERSEIRLEPDEERILTEAIVAAENLNIWALLMPTVYQLVPGSLIARLWFNAIFPPPLLEDVLTIENTNFQYLSLRPDTVQEAVFQNMMVIATSLALGLLLGLGLVQLLNVMLKTILCNFGFDQDLTQSQKQVRARNVARQGVMATIPEDDPDSDDDDNKSEEDGVEDVTPATNGGAQTRQVQFEDLVEDVTPASNGGAQARQVQFEDPKPSRGDEIYDA